MKKAIKGLILMAIMMLAVSGCQKEATIVGKWETGDPAKVINYEFTEDHQVIQDQLLSDGSWVHTVADYELKSGRLLRSSGAEVLESEHRHDEEVPAEIPVIYSIDGDTLVLEAISHLGKIEFQRVETFTNPNPNR